MTVSGWVGLALVVGGLILAALAKVFGGAWWVATVILVTIGAVLCFVAGREQWFDRSFDEKNDRGGVMDDFDGE
jgi:4-hydroxybenzoate polyprenyltransferase